MEFYFSVSLNSIVIGRFNSQRDGILLRSARSLRRAFAVSIPNGMEFYCRFCTPRSNHSRCFNSQRDGILLKFDYFIWTLQMFQFPTGWNSTNLLFDWKQILEFQFPTGWNSTFAFLRFLVPIIGFNSQRDGILHSSTTSIVWSVSFNSQRDGILLLAEGALKNIAEFQFPTGWNSTMKDRRWATKRNLVSIPNGMEFYQNE